MYSKRHYHGSKNSGTNCRGSHVLSKNLIIVFVIIFIILLITGVASAQDAPPTPDASAVIENDGQDISVNVTVKPWPQALLELFATTYSFLVAVITNPFGAINAGINAVVDAVANVLPSTPENLKLSNIASDLGEAVPLVGTAVIRAVLNTFIELGGLALIIKIYKLIPFKAT
ncbi:hypothetical protein [Synechocystis sp. CS-94]|uniref:hypothetical protein n=1 Tax=Synechocystis sp. CS-94 TaxID=2847986 RepID=UPI00223BF556|nr:hypothetical protein [Synechocystis sp. CS-94]MCT0252346.1 hypothetical protein [Synechocystis sp. CS-94]